MKLITYNYFSDMLLVRSFHPGIQILDIQTQWIDTSEKYRHAIGAHV